MRRVETNIAVSSSTMVESDDGTKKILSIGFEADGTAIPFQLETFSDWYSLEDLKNIRAALSRTIRNATRLGHACYLRPDLRRREE